MGIVNVFGKGSSVYGKHSSRLNVISQRIDRRLKENAAYRSSRPRKGKLVEIEGDTYIRFQDGRLIKSSVDIKKGGDS